MILIFLIHYPHQILHHPLPIVSPNSENRSSVSEKTDDKVSGSRKDTDGSRANRRKFNEFKSSHV